MRVLVIDDHTLFRVGLQELLSRRGIEVVGATSDGREGVRAAVDLQPDIILLDMRMPDIDGLGVLRFLRAEGTRAPVIMLTTSNDERDLVDCLRGGAQGYLLKDMEPDDLIDALHASVRGETVVAPDLMGVLAKAVQANIDEEKPAQAGAAPFGDLTPREREILCHLAEGQSNKVIARHLGISDGTVKLHVKAILRKLEVHSRVEAAVLAVEHSLCQKV